MFTLTRTHTFKKQFKIYQYDDKVVSRIQEIFDFLLQGKPLPSSYHQHSLQGSFLGYMECHVFPDILLVYKINVKEKLITLSYIGSHSDLFH